MNRFAPRLAKLEHDGPNGWRAWEHVRPYSFWPDRALLALLAQTEGWPPGHVPTEAELIAVSDQVVAEHRA